jgi:hypothetical protein
MANEFISFAQRRRKVPKSVWDESSAEGARGESPKAARGVGCGEGGSPSPQKIFELVSL